ncbi:MAG TPA: glycine oxidase ThiO [Rhizomicrobium sp.]
MKVVIVGAGVAGLAIGWRLKQAGADVTVLERAQPGRGATWAAAGMIAVAGEMGAAQTPEAEFGQHSSLLWPSFARELEVASDLPIGYRRSGALMVARTAAEAAAFDSWSGVERLGAAQALAKEPMLAGDIAAALWAPDEAQVDSRALGAALAKAFEGCGGKLQRNEAAVRFEVRRGRAVAVASPFQRYEADAFVLAAGAWSGEIGGLPPEALPPVRPVKGEMIAVAPPAGAAMPRHVVWGNEVYLVPRNDRLLIGATVAEAGFDSSVTDAAAGWLSSRAIVLMPALAKWDIVERWAGLRPGSPDGLPLLGRTAVAGLFAATGQYRNGILFAPAVAENMSRLVMEHAAEIPAFDPRRFPLTRRG